MKKTLNLICLGAVAVILFLLLPYLPPTFFSTLLVVGCMVALAIWGHILCKTPKTPVLTEEELDNLDELLEEEEAEGEAVSDNKFELASEGLAKWIHTLRQEQEEEGQQAPKIINIQKQLKERELANKKRRRRKKKKLAKHSRRQNR